MSKKRAFVRYTKKGKLIPGSLILTNGTYPNDGTYLEVNADLCCDFDPRITVRVRTEGGSGSNISNKPYDGNTGASIGGLIFPLEGVLLQDIGKVSAEANNDPFALGPQFVTSEVGNHIGVYPNDILILTGPSAYKYKIDPLAIIGYANIFPASVYITGLIPQNKPYDGNTTTTWVGTPVLNFTSGEYGAQTTLVIGTLAANFTSASIGQHRVYMTGFSITGPDSYRYSLAQPVDIGLATITP